MKNSNNLFIYLMALFCDSNHIIKTSLQVIVYIKVDFMKFIAIDFCIRDYIILMFLFCLYINVIDLLIK